MMSPDLLAPPYSLPPRQRLVIVLGLLAVHGGLAWWLTRPTPKLPEPVETVMIVDWREATVAPPAPARPTPPEPTPAPPSKLQPTAAPVTPVATPTLATTPSPAAPVAAPTPVVAAEPAPAPSAPPAPPAPAAPAGPVAVNFSELVALDRAKPTYPMLSRRLGETGTVKVRLKINEAGQVVAATLAVSTGFPRLDEAALAVVKRWRFVPPKRDGVAIVTETTAPISFNLE